MTDEHIYKNIKNLKNTRSDIYGKYLKSYNSTKKLKGDHKAGAMATLYVNMLWDILAVPPNQTAPKKYKY